MARVYIVNVGPETVKVEEQARNERGQYIEKSERKIPPGEACFVNVSDGETVQLIALPMSDDVES